MLTVLYKWWSRSIRWKLVGVFVIISVIPMLIATKFATQVVSTTFEDNVEAWLFQTSHFFVANILDQRRETASIADVLAENGSLTALVTGQSREMPPAVSHMINALGYDLLLISDNEGRVVFSSKPATNITSVPFGEGQKLYLDVIDGTPTLMAAGSSTFDYQGQRYHVLIGTLVDQSFVANMGALSSLTVRLYYKVNGQFTQVYASGGQTSVALPPATLTEVAGNAADEYTSADIDGEDTSIGIYAPIRDGNNLIGVLFCGLSSDSGIADWVTSKNLFIAIFAFGMLLSLGAGLIMSRLLTSPVIRLAEGVNAIAKGDFSQRVPTRRHDELGQLSVAFNSMAQQLEGLRKMEAKLRRRERMTTLGEVAAGLAHEVRNPLGIIKTSAELLQNSANLSEVETRRLGYVIDEVRRIDQLIRDFLAFARPPQRMTDLAPVDLVDRVLGSCQSEIEQQQVLVNVEDESGEARIHVDRDQMIQACLNLVLNALQAMEGTPELATAPGLAVRPRLDIRITTEGDEVHFIFADNGPGIPQTLIDRIFDPFVTTKDSGTGLGLARVFAVAEGHGGWIEARNATHGGAIFELVIPASQRRAGDVPNDPAR
ncbi:sensor histidine kinase [Labrys sp. ZIDIC5]|uniref:sensor histidine kinase n=1 Tax=Labrys sedimenti TaxID=3106036 RepID=UPI002ACA33A1|nr:ATP-binding protein [Labrys sp. ZIDIC5]MDZ5450972.1 HAMP domain-containing protein [Labrys sp. ZIDIC5]